MSDAGVDRRGLVPVPIHVAEATSRLGGRALAVESLRHQLLDAPLEVEAQLVVHLAAQARVGGGEAEDAAQRGARALRAHREGAAASTSPTASVYRFHFDSSAVSWRRPATESL